MSNPLFDQFFGKYEGAETSFLHLASGEIITHGAFLDLTAQLAGALVAGGLRHGASLAAKEEKSEEALALYGASERAGIG